MAQRLAYDIRRAGITLWFDESKLKPGDQVVTSIRTGIKDANHFLVLISRNSQSSSWVQQELRQAFLHHNEHGRPTIVPIRIDDSPVPEFLRSVLYVDFRTSYEEGLAALVELLTPNDQDDVTTAEPAPRSTAPEAPLKGSGPPPIRWIPRGPLPIVVALFVAIAAALEYWPVRIVVPVTVDVRKEDGWTRKKEATLLAGDSATITVDPKNNDYMLADGWRTDYHGLGSGGSKFKFREHPVGALVIQDGNHKELSFPSGVDSITINVPGAIGFMVNDEPGGYANNGGKLVAIVTIHRPLLRYIMEFFNRH